MQTEVKTEPDLGLPGQLADLFSASDADVVAKKSEEETASIPFGVMVAQGEEDDGVLNLAANNDRLVGIVVHAHGYNRDSELDDDGLRPGCTFDVLNEGRIIVRVEDSVTPSSEVHVRAVTGGSSGYGEAGAETAGAFRGTDDGADTINITEFARYTRSADAGELTIVDITMRGQPFQNADS